MPKPGILSNFSKNHRLRDIENLRTFKWRPIAC
ncbi:hypothetical protein T11_11840, partial [Trichinella zimbabwensis]